MAKARKTSGDIKPRLRRGGSEIEAFFRNRLGPNDDTGRAGGPSGPDSAEFFLAEATIFDFSDCKKMEIKTTEIIKKYDSKYLRALLVSGWPFSTLPSCAGPLGPDTEEAFELLEAE